ncbi:MAG: leucine-rich repeat domain-containing protein, partial [Candidatus Scatosoma sp.]
MKKIRWFNLILLASLCAFLAACGKKNMLATPYGIALDENNTLSWTLDENAKSYSVSIRNVDTGIETLMTSRKASYSLAQLEEGDYDIAIKAVGDGKTHQDSEWSEIIQFHKDYETGCVYTYIKNNTEYEITKVGSASKNVIVGETYRGKPVTKIADAAFKGSGRVEGISIGSNVTYIGDNAFYNCPKLTYVEMPDSVTYLGVSAFQSCRSLLSVNISKGVTELNNYVFAYCRSLTEIEIGDNIVTIGDSAFSDCSALQSVTIPDSVISIGDYAFTGDTSLATVSIGAGTESIGNNAFYRCSALEEITFSANGALKTLGEYAFSECAQIAETTLPEGLTDIGYACFYGAGALDSVSIPDTVNHVGGYAFHATKFFNEAKAGGEQFVYADKWLIHCTEETLKDLEKIGVDTLRADTFGIADYTFAGAPKLTEIKTPQSLKAIGNYAFAECNVLYRINTYDNSVESIGEYSFFNCPVLSQILFGEGLKKIGSYAFYGCSLLDNSALAGSSIIPDSVTSIGTYAFKNTALWKKPTSSGIVYAGNWVVGYNNMRSSTAMLNADTAGIAVAAVGTMFV